MSNVLVIHPDDRSTDFLKLAYEGKGYDVICDPDISRDDLINEIRSHDRILMMGHGCHLGLLHPGGLRVIVGNSCADLLREKETVSIWCFSDRYFRNNGLHGFHTGMIISETEEAYLMLGMCPLSREELLENMERMASCFHECIDMDPEEIREYMLAHYTGDDAITKFNRENMTVC